MVRYVDLDKIVAKIERRESNAKDRYFGRLVEDNYFLDFLNTLEVKDVEEEPVSEELEDAAYEFVMDNFGNPKEPLYKFDQRCFKAGAMWQLNQIRKKNE